MRDPDRIGPTLEMIRTLWLQNPDLRLGQLLLNAVPEDRLYHTEDNKILDALKETYK